MDFPHHQICVRIRSAAQFSDDFKIFSRLKIIYKVIDATAF